MNVSELCGLLTDARESAEEIRQILEKANNNKAVPVSTTGLSAYRNVIQAMTQFIEEMEIC